jgi:N-glycosylase/DNA lyase
MAAPSPMSTAACGSRIVARDPCAEGRQGSTPADRSSLACPGQLIQLSVEESTLIFRWGHPHLLGTPSYWVGQAGYESTPTFRLGSTLTEEVSACILGGFGMPAAIGLAAFRVLQSRGLIQTDSPPSAHEIEEILREPLVLENRVVHYRFPRQKAERLAACLDRLAAQSAPDDPLVLRTWLLGLPGIGPKTASWIVRNHCASSEVAIIDVHVRRAGLAAGFFSPSWKLPQDYLQFEEAFLEIARIGGVPAAALDACIWRQLQSLGRESHLLLGAST